MWISLDRYLAALCIITKLNPEIIIKMIEIDVKDNLFRDDLKFFINNNINSS